MITTFNRPTSILELGLLVTLTNLVGKQLSQANLKAPIALELPAAAPALIVQVNGRHILTKDKSKRSFEALSGVIYQPSCVEVRDQHHRQITDKSCVISAIDDDLKRIKTYVHHAALKQGLSDHTQVTRLADGASKGDERENADKPFTSQVAESHIDTLLHARHKRKQKMQWT